jgi:hypothetical protein
MYHEVRGSLAPEDGLSVGVKIGIVGFGFLVAFAAYEAYTRPGDPPELIAAQDAVAKDTAQKLVASLPVEARWNRITIDEATAVSFRLTLHYPAGFADPVQIAVDTKAVAQALVRQLTVAGHHPADERTVVEVAAREEAGASLGAAHFDPDRDGIVFQKPAS